MTTFNFGSAGQTDLDIILALYNVACCPNNPKSRDWATVIAERDHYSLLSSDLRKPFFVNYFDGVPLMVSICQGVVELEAYMNMYASDERERRGIIREVVDALTTARFLESMF